MRPTHNDADDKVVIDPELELRDQPPAVRAKGTREQISVPPVPRPTTVMPAVQPPREVNRDPAEVLRAWPHSMAGRDPRSAAVRAASLPAAAPPATARPAAAPRRPRVEDKIALAHLALDLFREVEQFEAGSRRASSEPGDAVCTNRGCDMRINALRGALAEACLLVQRVAMAPTDRADIEDRIHALLDLLEH